MRSLLLCVLLLTVGNAFAADAKLTHCLQKTVIPGTTYYFPDGRASHDSAWVNLGSYKTAPSYFSLYLLVDSTLGYDSPCSVRVEALYSIEDWSDLDGDSLRMDSTAFLGYPSTTVVFNEPFFVVPEDSARLISAGVYLHDKRRWRVTVTDSCSISFLEKLGKP